MPLTLIACATLGLSIASAHAGPCSDAIAQVQAAANQSTGNPAAGPTAPQSIGAQLGRQPTPESVQLARYCRGRLGLALISARKEATAQFAT
jgi:hypothetical protein